MDSRNERLVSFLNNTGFSIPEIAVKCGIEKSRRTIYKIVNEGHKPSPKILRAIKDQFPELDIPYIMSGKSRAVGYMLSELDKEEEEYNRPPFFYIHCYGLLFFKFSLFITIQQH